MLKRIFKEFLFTKGIFVGEQVSEDAFATCFALANKFGISIASGHQYANKDMISLAEDMLGEDIPAPFYRNFPASVRELSPDKLLFDQLMHYSVTYGLGNFSNPGHSIFEKDFERLAFREQTEIKKFVILEEQAALERLKEGVDNMLKGTRPLSASQYYVVLAYVRDYNYEFKNCACKDTAIRLLIDTQDAKYAKFISLSDVIKLVDIINYNHYRNENIKKLNFRNQDRKFITKIIDTIFEKGYIDIRECFEKKKIWCGLLHHIHYKPKSDDAAKFVSLMRGKENNSVYSEFESAMLEKNITAAVTALKEGKGQGALLRHLNYILSRCEREEDVEFVMNSISAKNAIILIQLIIQYANYIAAEQRNDNGSLNNNVGRCFKFTSHNKLKVHYETPEEQAKRKSRLAIERVNKLLALMHEKLKSLLANRLGKVYISPEMRNIAIPIQENASSGGYGVLPKGSRIHIGEDKKIRAFTYWEKVDDIDLSIIGIGDYGYQEEFSWRTMFALQSSYITFSGDETSGYDGGSEYYDLDITFFKDMYPQLKYLIFCDNVYSSYTFSECFCKAGYMLRDTVDSGEIFEPKTVKTSFRINCDSTFAYLFGIDLEKNDFVWLNTTRDSSVHVAGTTSVEFLLDYFNTTSVLNVAMLFEMLAAEIVDNPSEADVVVSDEELDIKENAEQIRSCDFEKITALLN